MLLTVVIVSLVLAGSFAYYLLKSGSDFPSPSCAALSVAWTNLPYQQSGFRYFCGQNAVTDGRIKISLDSYRFADGSSIDWVCPSNVDNGSSRCSSSGIFLLANITVENVGSGNTSIGPTFFAQVNDSSGTLIANGEYGADAVFPGQNPSTSIPPVDGGTFLPPAAKATYWFIFYMPNTALSDVPSLKLHSLSFPELSYGGDWLGGGSYRCMPVPCQNPDTELIILR